MMDLVLRIQNRNLATLRRRRSLRLAEITIYNYLPKNPNGSIPTHILAEEICKRMQNGDLKVFLDPNNNQSPLIPSQNCKCN